jgi:hypothetical protein
VFEFPLTSMCPVLVALTMFLKDILFTTAPYSFPASMGFSGLARRNFENVSEHFVKTLVEFYKVRDFVTKQADAPFLLKCSQELDLLVAVGHGFELKALKAEVRRVCPQRRRWTGRTGWLRRARPPCGGLGGCP